MSTRLACAALAIGGLWVNADATDQPGPPARTSMIRPAPLQSVQLDDGFWRPREEANARVTSWHNLAECERTGRLSNFARAAGREQGKFQGLLFDDSDVYKAIEGCAYVLMTHDDAALRARVDEIIEVIAAAQQPDGYLNTYFTLVEPENRWKKLRHSHELYCAGHLIEAGIAYRRATGNARLFDIAVRFADLINERFGPGKDSVGVPGHQELELALVKLWNETGEKKYLDLAHEMLERRGRPRDRESYQSYAQDHEPVGDQREAVGHAVRAVYMYCAMADILRAGKAAYWPALDALWQDVTRRKLYITGGIGGIPGHEGFGDAYQLPNRSAYNETCAAIANALWAWRMFLLTGDAQYIDALELSAYNSMLSGVSQSGDQFFYPNPLEADAHSPFNHGQAERCPWFGCACCPPNVLRFVPQVPGMAYAFDDDGLWVNLFIQGDVQVETPFGRVHLRVDTEYPWAGDVHIEVLEAPARPFTLRLRIPGWTGTSPVAGDLYRTRRDEHEQRFRLTSGDNPLNYDMDLGYATLTRRWIEGERVDLALPMPARRVEAHPQLDAASGAVALMRGPIVYCIEAADHGGRVSNLFLPPDASLVPWFDDALLGGAGVIEAPGMLAHVGPDGQTTQIDPVPLRAIPYALWCSRGRGEMKVWIPESASGVKPAPAPTLAMQARPAASHTWNSDTPAALNDGDEPRNSADGNIARHTFWNHVGTSEWYEYTFPDPVELHAADLYWFDDTGQGRCRVPATWRLLYRTDAGWSPVEVRTGEFGVQPDRYNSVEFAPVRTTGLRIELTLREGFSAGALEWKVR